MHPVLFNWSLLRDGVTLINNRYKLDGVISNGANALVCGAYDTSRTIHVAIKVMRHHGRTSASRRACEIADQLAQFTARELDFFPLLIERITFNGYHCLVYEKYGMSLGQLILSPGALPIPLRQIRLIAWQLIKAVNFLHNHLGIVHTDVKPDNIVLVDDTLLRVVDMDDSGSFITISVLQDPHIKLIDLDDCVSFTPNQTLRTLVGTVRYRAPEVLAEIGWSFPMDVFAIACTIFEIYKSRPLLPHTDNIRVMFLYMQDAVGYFTPRFRDEAAAIFVDLFSPGLPIRVKIPKEIPESDQQDYDLLADSEALWSSVRYPDLADLLRQCLVLDPKFRLSPRNALGHRFFKGLARAP